LEAGVLIFAGLFFAGIPFFPFCAQTILPAHGEHGGLRLLMPVLTPLLVASISPEIAFSSFRLLAIAVSA